MTQDEQAIAEIRNLISEANMEEAVSKTRLFLESKGQEDSILQLDMIEAEWNDVRTQTLGGLLSVDDQVRLNNISRAKLLSLVLIQSGDEHLAERLTTGLPKAGSEPATRSDKNAQQNNDFKNGLKNAIGILFFIITFGAFIGHDYVFGIFILLSGIICFVPTLRFIEKTIGFQFLSWHKYALLLVFLIVSAASTKERLPTKPSPSTDTQKKE